MLSDLQVSHSRLTAKSEGTEWAGILRILVSIIIMEDVAFDREYYRQIDTNTYAAMQSAVRHQVAWQSTHILRTASSAAVAPVANDTSMPPNSSEAALNVRLYFIRSILFQSLTFMQALDSDNDDDDDDNQAALGLQPGELLTVICAIRCSHALPVSGRFTGRLPVALSNDAFFTGSHFRGGYNERWHHSSCEGAVKSDHVNG
jgi:hypothetical protein